MFIYICTITNCNKIDVTRRIYYDNHTDLELQYYVLCIMLLMFLLLIFNMRFVCNTFTFSHLFSTTTHAILLKMTSRYDIISGFYCICSS